MNADRSRDFMRSLVLEVEDLAADHRVRDAFDNPRPTTASRRVAIYIRASDEAIVDYQRERLTDYAALKGWDVVSTYVGKRDDPSTAKLSQRPDLRNFKEAFDADVDIDAILISNYGVLASTADLYLELKRHFDREIIAMNDEAVYEVL